MAEIAGYSEEDLVYLDESGIHEFLYNPYGRAPRGTQVFTDVKGSQYQRCNMIAAWCNTQIVAPMVFQGSCDRNVFETWLEKCLITELKPGQVVIMDNYVIHKSRKVKQLIEQAGCKLLFLPTYSPDLNPIEKYWANLKRNIRQYLQKYNFQNAIDYAFKYT